MPKFCKPRLFIGSSVEGLPIAKAIVANLDYNVDCNLWAHAFPLSYNTIDSLLNELKKSDFAAFVLSADDITRMREKEFATSRDNVLFEAGLAIGRYGKLRCFLIVPRDVPEFHIPTDLLGITMSTYNSDRAASDPNNSLITSTSQILSAITKNIWATVRLNILSRVDSADPNKLTFKNKVFLSLINLENVSIRIELKEAKLKKYHIDSVHNVYGGRKDFKPKFITSLAGNGKQKQYSYQEHILKSGERIDIWIPIDPKILRTDIKASIDKDSLGSLEILIEILDGSEQRFIKTIEF